MAILDVDNTILKNILSEKLGRESLFAHHKLECVTLKKNYTDNEKK